MEGFEQVNPIHEKEKMSIQELLGEFIDENDLTTPYDELTPEKQEIFDAFQATVEARRRSNPTLQ